ncbi:response regulator transcription factor [Dactylosporangium aurantiacum]|uniref:Response regulator transcription factor n=1 Tax=Dactylosporangium aurantiacum TaxID=35754 RepID=A0A9Q9IUT6_9ACTN|nr:response regulator transcription factor [Dactylosporangium aurantiacum]
MVRVLVAGDLHMVRGAFVALIEQESDLCVVAEVDRGDYILPRARICRPDVAIIDIDLPGLDGLTAAARLRQELPSCKTLILTTDDRPATVRRALTVAVSGFLLKAAPSTRLAEAIREVAAGVRVMDPHLAISAYEVGENPLSARETQVLRQIADGAGADEIAEKLRLSVGTVRNYLTTIVIKLNARNRVDAARIAHSQGWIP